MFMILLHYLSILASDNPEFKNCRRGKSITGREQPKASQKETLQYIFFTKKSTNSQIENEEDPETSASVSPEKNDSCSMKRKSKDLKANNHKETANSKRPSRNNSRSQGIQESTRPARTNRKPSKCDDFLSELRSEVDNSSDSPDSVLFSDSSEDAASLRSNKEKKTLSQMTNFN